MARPLAVSLLVALLLALQPRPVSPATCRFVLGFQTLHDHLTQIVGDCLEDEHHNPITGDTIQRTTRGLLVWRKADNWTAFTDGYRTWVMGPAGLQVRLNNERFRWEADCLEVGLPRCLILDPRLRPAASVLQSQADGRTLLQIAALAGVQIQRGALPPSAWGFYYAPTRIIVLNTTLDQTTPQVQTAALAHELQHAADHAAGLWPRTALECYDLEARAFIRQASLWASFWPRGLPPAIDRFHAELNAITVLVAAAPAGFVVSLLVAYQHECLGS